MKKFDWYITKKFFSTFFFTLFLVLLIVIVFDISEKIDDFLENNLSIKLIITEYYIHFIPYFGNLFSPLFIFLSVIFFTSKLANNTEIIAMTNSGLSFYQYLRPFIICSIILSTCSFFLGNFIIPESNKHRIDFENKYISKKRYVLNKEIHMQIAKDQYIYMESFNINREIGYKFRLDNFNKNKLMSTLNSDYIKYDSITTSWELNNYTTRIFYDDREVLNNGRRLDTIIDLKPDDFQNQIKLVETMKYAELNKYIVKESLKGTPQIVYHKIEKHKRIAFPFASIILTIIAVSIASRKVRGGIGLHLGLGILIAFSFILFMQISTTFAIKSSLNPALSVWIPNILFTIVAVFLVKKAPK